MEINFLKYLKFQIKIVALKKLLGLILNYFLLYLHWLLF